jgi:hypothetical protein
MSRCDFNKYHRPRGLTTRPPGTRGILFRYIYLNKKLLTRKSSGEPDTTKQKERRGENLSQRDRKACHSISTALLQSVAEIGTQNTMMSSGKTLHEFSPHIPPKTPKRNINSSTNEIMHTDITLKAQRTRVTGTHAREANSHQNSKAINQLSRHKRQPASILYYSEGVVFMDRLNRRRAKQSGSAEVRIEFAMLSSQCKTAREWETSTHTRSIYICKQVLIMIAGSSIC